MFFLSLCKCCFQDSSFHGGRRNTPKAVSLRATWVPDGFQAELCSYKPSHLEVINFLDDSTDINHHLKCEARAWSRIVRLGKIWQDVHGTQLCASNWDLEKWWFQTKNLFYISFSCTWSSIMFYFKKKMAKMLAVMMNFRNDVCYWLNNIMLLHGFLPTIQPSFITLFIFVYDVFWLLPTRRPSDPCDKARSIISYWSQQSIPRWNGWHFCDSSWQ